MSPRRQRRVLALALLIASFANDQRCLTPLQTSSRSHLNSARSKGPHGQGANNAGCEPVLPLRRYELGCIEQQVKVVASRLRVFVSETKTATEKTISSIHSATASPSL